MTCGLHEVGSVLTTLPVVIIQLREYDRGLKEGHKYGQCRWTVADYSSSLRTQHAIFANHLYFLFRKIVGGGVELSALFDDPRGPMWADGVLQARFHERLGYGNDVFMRSIYRIQETLRELEGKLEVDLVNDGSKVSDGTCSSRKQHPDWYLLYFSLSQGPSCIAIPPVPWYTMISYTTLARQTTFSRPLSNVPTNLCGHRVARQRRYRDDGLASKVSTSCRDTAQECYRHINEL